MSRLPQTYQTRLLSCKFRPMLLSNKCVVLFLMSAYRECKELGKLGVLGQRWKINSHFVTGLNIDTKAPFEHVLSEMISMFGTLFVGPEENVVL